MPWNLYLCSGALPESGVEWIIGEVLQLDANRGVQAAKYVGTWVCSLENRILDRRRPYSELGQFPGLTPAPPGSEIDVVIWRKSEELPVEGFSDDVHVMSVVLHCPSSFNGRMLNLTSLPNLDNCETAVSQQPSPLTLGALNATHAHHVQIFPRHLPRGIDIRNNHVRDKKLGICSHGRGCAGDDCPSVLIVPVV